MHTLPFFCCDHLTAVTPSVKHWSNTDAFIFTFTELVRNVVSFLLFSTAYTYDPLWLKLLWTIRQLPPPLRTSHHLPRIRLFLPLTPLWVTRTIYLDERFREAFDRDGPGQAGVTQVGVISLLQLSLTSEQSLQGWDSHNHNHRGKQLLFLCVITCVKSCVQWIVWEPGPFSLSCSWPHPASVLWECLKSSANIERRKLQTLLSLLVQPLPASICRK